MGQQHDDLDSSDDEDHFPPSQAFEKQVDAGKNKLMGAGANIAQSKASKFDKLLQKGPTSNAEGRERVKLPSVF